MKKEKFPKIGRWLLVVALFVAIVVCFGYLYRINSKLDRLSETEELNPLVQESENPITIYIIEDGVDKVLKKDTKDFFDTMGEAVMKAEVVDCEDITVVNTGTDQLDVDWFWWSESGIGYLDYCPIILEKDFSTTIQINGFLENSVYLVHAKYNSMDKYIAFRPKLK